MARILVTYGVPTDGFEALAPNELMIPEPLATFAREKLMELLPQADAVLSCTALDRELIERASSLRLIVCYGAGYDAIDVRAATERGVMVCNTPECVTAPTAEVAVAHIMALARRIPELDRLVRTPGERPFGIGKRMGASLDGATLGIVGMGRIGGRVADFGRCMGMRVLYTSRSPKPERDALGDERVLLETLLRESDFVSLHCPLTEETKGLLSRDKLALMKPTAYLINTSRGAVIDEQALCDALRERSIAGAGLDVFCGEPHIDPALQALDNVVLTPHIGSNTIQARKRMAEAASERILDMLAGRVPRNLLNPEVLK